MIAEPLAAPQIKSAPKKANKNAEIAALAEKAEKANAALDVLLTAQTKSIVELFAVLPAQTQADLLFTLAETLQSKDAALHTQTLNKMRNGLPVSAAGILKNHPAAEEYDRILREMREQQRKEDELMYPDDPAENPL